MSVSQMRSTPQSRTAGAASVATEASGRGVASVRSAKALPSRWKRGPWAGVPQRITSRKATVVSGQPSSLCASGTTFTS